MKKLILLAIVMGLLLIPAMTQNVVADDPVMAQNTINPPRVLCCCNTPNGICCAWLPVCTGFVPGCLCVR